MNTDPIPLMYGVLPENSTESFIEISRYIVVQSMLSYRNYSVSVVYRMCHSKVLHIEQGVYEKIVISSSFITYKHSH